MRRASRQRHVNSLRGKSPSSTGQVCCFGRKASAVPEQQLHDRLMLASLPAD
jgi:hypothetical protein